MYEIYYWPHILGRGEFVRLVLEDAGAEYRDVAREEGVDAVRGFMGGDEPVFAPPFLRDGDLLLSQTVNINAYVAARLGCVPDGDGLRAVANQIALTIADVVDEAHDVHHPISVGLYYEDQKEAAAKAAAHFRDRRLARWLGHFESILRNNGEVLVGDDVSYCDLSLAHLLDGLEYAFPRAFESVSADTPRCLALREHVKSRANIESYLSSPRRIDFNEDGIFRHYAELDRSVEV